MADFPIETEYIPLNIASRQAIWTCYIISNIEKTLKYLPISLIVGNNKVSLQLLKSFSNISKIKHIDTSFYQIVYKVKKGFIKLFWLPNEEMLADEFMKPLLYLAFEDKQVCIGVVDVEKHY